MSQKLSSCDRRDRHRYRQELVPHRGHDQRGAIVLRQKWSRGQVRSTARQPATVLNRYGGLRRGAHLSRKLQMLGHDARTDAREIRAPLFEGTEE